MEHPGSNVPPQTVQLRHELPDGSWHIDWLLDLAPAEDRGLTTFRLPGRVDELTPGRHLTAERLADHRRVYLTYEGPVSEERGHVTRVAEGRIEAVQSVGETWAFQIRWQTRSPDAASSSRCQHLRVRRRDNGSWLVEDRGRKS